MLFYKRLIYLLLTHFQSRQFQSRNLDQGDGGSTKRLTQRSLVTNEVVQPSDALPSDSDQVSKKVPPPEPLAPLLSDRDESLYVGVVGIPHSGEALCESSQIKVILLTPVMEPVSEKKRKLLLSLSHANSYCLRPRIRK